MYQIYSVSKIAFLSAGDQTCVNLNLDKTTLADSLSAYMAPQKVVAEGLQDKPDLVDERVKRIGKMTALHSPDAFQLQLLC